MTTASSLTTRNSELSAFLLPQIVDNINSGNTWNSCLNYVSAGFSGVQEALPIFRVLKGVESLKLLNSIRKFDLPGRANQSVVGSQLGKLRRRLIKDTTMGIGIDKSLGFVKSQFDSMSTSGQCGCDQQATPQLALRGMYN